MNDVFFLASLGRCLPELTDVVIEAAAAVQRTEIEEELLKMRLKRRCFLALAQLSPMSVVQGLKSENLPVDGSEKAVRRSPQGRDPFFDDSGTLACGVHLDSPAETRLPALVSPERTGREAAPAENGAKFSPGGSSEPLQSGPHPANTNCLSVPQLNKTNPEHRPAGLSAEDHNRFPKGRW